MNNDDSIRNLHQQALIDQTKNMSRKAHEESGEKTDTERKGY